MGAVSANWGKPMCLQNDGVQRPLGRSQGPWECPKAPGEVPRSLGMTQCPWECPKVPGEVSGRSPKSLERSHSPWGASYPDSVKKLSWKKAYPVKKFLEQIFYIILYHIILYHIIYYCIMLHYTTIHYIILARVCKIIEFCCTLQDYRVQFSSECCSFDAICSLLQLLQFGTV